MSAETRGGDGVSDEQRRAIENIDILIGTAENALKQARRECYEWIKQLDTVSAPASPPKERT